MSHRPGSAVYALAVERCPKTRLCSCWPGLGAPRRCCALTVWVRVSGAVTRPVAGRGRARRACALSAPCGCGRVRGGDEPPRYLARARRPAGQDGGRRGKGWIALDRRSARQCSQSRTLRRMETSKMLSWRHDTRDTDSRLMTSASPGAGMLPRRLPTLELLAQLMTEEPDVIPRILAIHYRRRDGCCTRCSGDGQRTPYPCMPARTAMRAREISESEVGQPPEVPLRGAEPPARSSSQGEPHDEGVRLMSLGWKVVAADEGRIAGWLGND